MKSERLELSPKGQLLYFPEAFSRTDADRLFANLIHSLDWAERSIMLFGREVMQPRLVAFYGDLGLAYRYSGTTLLASGWPDSLHEVHQRLVDLTGDDFNSVLCNLYRSGADSMGWHADNEPELGREPVIASISLGAGRRFVLKRRRDGKKYELEPAHGSLLVMSGQLQNHWVHQVPRTRKPVGARINLTFRRIVNHHR